uniref:Uncharacterized protein n=1 Tax=Leersia perrieri TaxID=77586 RepID=A0A0D9X002_9ORYZ
MAGLDLNQPFKWDEVDDLEGEIPDLNYNYVWYSESEVCFIGEMKKTSTMQPPPPPAMTAAWKMKVERMM